MLILNQFIGCHGLRLASATRTKVPKEEVEAQTKKFTLTFYAWQKKERVWVNGKKCWMGEGRNTRIEEHDMKS